MTHRLLPLFATALAPLIWGTTYLVTTEYLPPARPLTAAVLRVLPAGLLLLLWTREWPRRQEVTRLIVLGILNICLFQAMLFISGWCPKMYAGKRRANKKQRKHDIFELCTLKLPFTVPVAVDRI